MARVYEFWTNDDPASSAYRTFLDDDGPLSLARALGYKSWKDIVLRPDAGATPIAALNFNSAQGRLLHDAFATAALDWHTAAKLSGLSKRKARSVLVAKRRKFLSLVSSRQGFRVSI